MEKLKWAAVVLLMLFLFACGGSSVDGTYYNVDDAKEYIQLQTDGVFHLKAGNMEMTGKYVVEGKSIILNPDKKIVARGKIENGMIVDDDGTKWKKK